VQLGFGDIEVVVHGMYIVSEHVAHLFSSDSHPLIQIFIFSSQLWLRASGNTYNKF
jgi:hypothetical protein